MHPTTHFLTGWLVANSATLNKRERAIVSIAAIMPDIDGLGAIAEIATKGSDKPLLWWSKYHHIVGHNLTFALLCAIVGFAVAKKRVRTALLVFASFHIHLLGDLIGGRGPDGDQWPITYFWPFSEQLKLTWQGQWLLNAWPNFLITGIALAMLFYLAWKRGYSPLELLSQKADKALVKALRTRFGDPEQNTE